MYSACLLTPYNGISSPFDVTEFGPAGLVPPANTSDPPMKASVGLLLTGQSMRPIQILDCDHDADQVLRNATDRL
jgi:hypothetical protein